MCTFVLLLTTFAQAVPYYLEGCNAGAAIFENDSMNGEQRKRKVNELGLQWLLDLIERVERAHSKVLIQTLEVYKSVKKKGEL